MVTSEHEYNVTQHRLEDFKRRLERLEATPLEAPVRAGRIAGTRGQIATLERELALWKAGIREEVPGTPDYPYGPEDVDERTAVLERKCAEIANIDRQIGILLDRIADWRRHRAWLEREIATLEADATERQPQHSQAG